MYKLVGTTDIFSQKTVKQSFVKFSPHLNKEKNTLVRIQRIQGFILFQLLKLEIHCDDHLSLSYTSAVHI